MVWKESNTTTINQPTMAIWKAAFAALSLFAAVEGFTTPSMNRMSHQHFMTATMAEPSVGATSSENIRNIAV